MRRYVLDRQDGRMYQQSPGNGGSWVPYEDAAALERDLNAAQDRVRELEAERDISHVLLVNFEDGVTYVRTPGELEKLRNASHKHRTGREWEFDTSYQPGPITDPTQGVVTPSMSNSPAACDERDWERGGRPECVPADCQHYIELPSGLWAWVEDDAVRFEASESYQVIQCMVAIDYEHLPTKYRAHIERADFLAARALGVRVLGWAK